MKPCDTGTAHEACARAAHEVNRAYCLAIGDGSQPSWENAPDWQKVSALKGVVTALAGATPRESHEAWRAEKERDGWVYGETKDPAAKKHPCMVPYDALPPEQREKDMLFLCAVRPMARALGLEVTYPPTDEGTELIVRVANSSNVDEIAYDERSKKCRVRFKGGGFYESNGTLEPEEFGAFARARSKGEHFAKHLKARGFSKVEGAAS
jgi:hypothetical protein